MSKSQLRIRLPTLLIIGEADVFFYPKAASDCFEHVDRFYYEVVDGTSRSTTRDQAGKVNKLLAKFLKVDL